MPDVPDSYRLQEYRALRATVSQRGSLRIVLVVCTFFVWALTILLASTLPGLPFFSFVPLVVLVAGFEAVFALHVGVERIGRYIQAHHEPASSGQARWEETAMGFQGPAGGAHPLFPAVFIGATLINLTLGILFGLDGRDEFSFENWRDWIPVTLVHLIVFARIVNSSRFAASQRARDLEEFRRLLK